MTQHKLAVIGGGLTGLTAAIRAAQKGYAVDLYEAAPALGGRTRSFFHAPTQTWVDNGPHLLIGVYQRTQALLEEVGALPMIQWQDALTLPLWDAQRGNFALKTSAKNCTKALASTLSETEAVIVQGFRASTYGKTVQADE